MLGSPGNSGSGSGGSGISSSSSSSSSDGGSTSVVVPDAVTPVAEEPLLGVQMIKSSSI